jgi:hypothetical protein
MRASADTISGPELLPRPAPSTCGCRVPVALTQLVDLSLPQRQLCLSTATTPPDRCIILRTVGNWWMTKRVPSPGT